MSQASSIRHTLPFLTVQRRQQQQQQQKCRHPIPESSTHWRPWGRLKLLVGTTPTLKTQHTAQLYSHNASSGSLTTPNYGPSWWFQHCQLVCLAPLNRKLTGEERRGTHQLLQRKAVTVVRLMYFWLLQSQPTCKCCGAQDEDRNFSWSSEPEEPRSSVGTACGGR